MTAKWQAERDKLEGTRHVMKSLIVRAPNDIAKREGNLAKKKQASCHMALFQIWEREIVNASYTMI
jgi:hypothetical protein